VKEPHFYGAFALDDSTFGKLDPIQHRARRDIINPFFQPKAVNELSSKIIQPKVSSSPISMMPSKADEDLRWTN